MTYTSAEAAKLLRKLNAEYDALLLKEGKSREFLASVGEDVESVRPAYDYAATQEKLGELETKIRRLKHAINVFNATTVIPSFGMTIDEMLVYIPQLTKKKAKLAAMSEMLPKSRAEEPYGRQSSVIDYRYANYDIDAVTADLAAVSDELASAQLALDAVNHQASFEIDL